MCNLICLWHAISLGALGSDAGPGPGAAVGQSDMKEIAGLLKEQGVWLISDESNAAASDGHFSALQCTAHSDKAIILEDLSYALSVNGWGCAHAVTIIVESLAWEWCVG